MDEGPIVAQAAVPVLDDDTPQSLGARVLEQEHRIYPLALRLVASGTVRVEGNRVLGATMRAEDVLLAPSLS
jgi:phosphoribosylglycinamide formyltransferase-1